MVERSTFPLALILLLAGCAACPPGSWTQLPCCQGGARQQIASINTGTAPWRVMNPSTGTFQPVATPAADVDWTSISPAQWVRPPGQALDEADYVFELPFNVAPCPGQGAVQLAGQFAADNHATVYLDGNMTPIATSQGVPDWGFLPAAVTPFSASIPYNASGTHTLKVVVTNSSAITGLIVQGAIKRICSDAMAPTDPVN